MTQDATRNKIAILGSASHDVSSDLYDKAHAIGAATAELGGIVLTGACPGLPHAAALGAAAKGGLTIGISPAAHLNQHLREFAYPTDSKILIYTGMGRKGRNVILVRSSDACIFVGGGMGTLNEFTIAVDELREDNAIAILLESGGIADELPRLLSLYGKTPRPLIIQESNPMVLVQRVFSHLREE